MSEHPTNQDIEDAFTDYFQTLTPTHKREVINRLQNTLWTQHSNR